MLVVDCSSDFRQSISNSPSGPPPPPPADDLDELLRDFSEIIGREEKTPPASAEAQVATTTSPTATGALEWNARVPSSPAMKMELPV